MKLQLLKATVFALLQASAVRSHEEAGLSEKTIRDVANGAAVAVDRTKGRCDNDLNCCLNDCDEFSNGSRDWRLCRLECECDYGRNRNNVDCDSFDSWDDGRNGNRNGRRPDYCNDRKDFDCYPLDGRPPCCEFDNGRDCPNRAPSCFDSDSWEDRRDGNRNGRRPDYCNDRKDFDCYPLDGRPPCCEFDNGEDCPRRAPSCFDSDSWEDRRDGNRNGRRPDYCNDRKDFDCYPGNGRPPCCRIDNGEDCPIRAPSCFDSEDWDDRRNNRPTNRRPSSPNPRPSGSSSSSSSDNRRNSNRRPNKRPNSEQQHEMKKPKKADEKESRKIDEKEAKTEAEKEAEKKAKKEAEEKDKKMSKKEDEQMATEGKKSEKKVGPGGLRLTVE